MIPCDLYSREGITLPFLIDIQHEKWTEENEVKYRYTKKYIVLNSDANTFIEEAPLEYNGQGLSSINREDDGRLSTITLVYGEAFNPDYDGFLEWWTTSNGLWSYHIRKRIPNNITAIRQFCEDCLIPRYRLENQSTSAIPEPGAEFIYGEATWSETAGEGFSAGGESGEGGEGEPGEDEEDGITEEANSVQFSSSIEQLSIPPLLYLEKNCEWSYDEVRHMMEAIELVDSGSVVYKKKGEFGNYITEDGWYPASSNIAEATTRNQGIALWITPEHIAEAKTTLNNIVPISVPVIRCSVTTTISSESPMSMSSISTYLGRVGELSKTIVAGGVNFTVPEKALELQCSPYEVEVYWMNEGVGFDGNTVITKRTQEGKTYYSGSLTHSFRSFIKLKDTNPSAGCPEYTETQAV